MLLYIFFEHIFVAEEVTHPNRETESLQAKRPREAENGFYVLERVIKVPIESQEGIGESRYSLVQEAFVLASAYEKLLEAHDSESI